MKKSIVKSFTEHFSHDFWLGIGSASLGWFLSFMAPIWPFILFALVLVLTDLYTGIRAARKRGEVIRSGGLKRTVEKFTLYCSGILMAKGMQDVFELPVNVVYMVAFTISLTEVKSNFENIEAVTGVNIWSQIMHLLKPGKKP